MKTHKWKDIKSLRMSPREIAEAERGMDADSRARRTESGGAQEELADDVKVAQAEMSRPERLGDYGGDEETTLPPPPPDEPIPAGPAKPFAFGDFRTYETTFAALGEGSIVEVQLVSDRGDRAHFAMDRKLAALVATELERQLTEASNEERKLSGSSHHDRFLLAAPPKLAQRALPGTDVFFTLDEAPTVRVTQESRGDRIILHIRSDEASLRITMQGGVAAALWRFLARAGRER